MAEKLKIRCPICNNETEYKIKENDDLPSNWFMITVAIIFLILFLFGGSFILDVWFEWKHSGIQRLTLVQAFWKVVRQWGFWFKRIV